MLVRLRQGFPDRAHALRKNRTRIAPGGAADGFFLTTAGGEESIEFRDNDVQIKAVEARMARHNRESRGTDQRGFDYVISYQPDWLQVVKVTRNLESGRQSTKTLFRNPGWREQPPGARVRTRIASPEQELDFEIVVNDPRGAVKRVVVETTATKEDGTEETILFTMEDLLPPPPDGGDGDGEGDEGGGGQS